MADNSQTKKAVSDMLKESAWGPQPLDLLRMGVNEIARLENLLAGRDQFIVDKGLWDEFVRSLP